jgi:hypothetical protein
MAIQSYLSTTEATERFPNDVDYSAPQRASALIQSFSLVNSFLDSKLNVPVLCGWDGETTETAPDILKIVQGMFYTWLLQTSNVGYPEEMNTLFAEAVGFAKKITENELSISGAMTFEREVGWHIVKKTQVTGYTGKGGVWIRGAAPSILSYLRIVLAGVADVMEGEVKTVDHHAAAGGHVVLCTDGKADFSFSIYRGDSPTAVSSANIPYYDWHSYSDGTNTFDLRWDGEWGAASELRIVGVPESAVDQPTINKDTMYTAPVSY